MSKKLKNVTGNAMWVKVFEPDTKFNPDGVYSVDLLKPQLEATNLSDYLEGLVNDRLEEEMKSNPKYKGKLSTHLPFEEDYDKENNPTGDIKFKFKSEQAYTKIYSLSTPSFSTFYHGSQNASGISTLIGT